MIETEETHGVELLKAFIEFHGIENLSRAEKWALRLCNKTIKTAVEANTTHARIPHQDAFRSLLKSKCPLTSLVGDWTSCRPEEFKLLMDAACHQFPLLGKVEINLYQHFGELPESIGQLSLLRDLSIKAQSFALPLSVAQLTNLERLSLRLTSGTRGPDIQGIAPIQHFENLKELTLEDNQKEPKLELPEYICHFSSLQILRLRCNAQTLPENFGMLTQVETLLLELPMLQILPKSFADLSSLRILEIYKSKYLKRLPEDFGRLTSLERLDIDTCRKLETLPESIGALKSLKDLEITNCTRLQGLPSSIADLGNSLTLLDLLNLCWTSLPESIAALTCLKELTISHFDDLETVPESLTQLTSLTSLMFSDCYGDFLKMPHSVKAMPAFVFDRYGDDWGVSD